MVESTQKKSHKIRIFSFEGDIEILGTQNLLSY